jgi:hypothetical protein
MWYALQRREIHTGFWWEKLVQRNRSEDLGVDGRIILKSFIHQQVLNLVYELP